MNLGSHASVIDKLGIIQNVKIGALFFRIPQDRLDGLRQLLVVFARYRDPKAERDNANHGQGRNRRPSVIVEMAAWLGEGSD